MLLRAVWCALALALLLPALPLPGIPAGAWGDETHGFLEVEGAQSRDSTLSLDGRIRLEYEHQAPSFVFHLGQDLLYDAVEGRGKAEVREAYLDFPLSPSVNVRAGRQIITWGVGDLLFLNDLFPKDYRAFFSGKPSEFLKVGVDAIKVDLSLGASSLELVGIPMFRRDRLPQPQRFDFSPSLPPLPVRESFPDSSLDRSQVAARYSTTLGRDDFSLYAYRGFFTTPMTAVVPGGASGQGGEAPSLLLFYPRLFSYGASLQGNRMGGVLSLECAYHDSRDDPAGLNPAIENSRLRLLIGYSRQMGKDLTGGFQYFVEKMLRYREYRSTIPPGLPVKDEYNHLLTMRLTQLMRYQTVRVSFLTFYSLNDHDYLVVPEVRYQLTDRESLTVGMNLFGRGDPLGFFSPLARNDNLYATFRYDF